MAEPNSTFLCCHCGNVAVQVPRFEYTGNLLYEEIDHPYYEPFDFVAYVCSTCSGLNLTGCFRHEQPEPRHHSSPRPLLYPTGPFIDPPIHTVDPDSPVPAAISRVYLEAWPLRHRAPSAFANQVRRALEFICANQAAAGDTLHQQLQDLETRGVLPKGLARMAALLRQFGNIGSHATKRDIDRWDAELIDALFQMILEYVYVGPARIARLEQRMKSHTEANDVLHAPSPEDDGYPPR